jgi:peroxiredoxin family protein
MGSGKISIVCVSDKREHLQMAAMMASVGAVSGRPVLVFFSMNALRYFVKASPERAPAEGPVGRLLDEKKVTPFQELFQNAVDLGDARLHPCSMAMDLLALEPEQLLPCLGEPMGLMQFLDEAAGGEVWSF